MTSATETQGNEAGDVLQFYDSKLVNLSESSSLLAIMMAMSEYTFGASIATSSRLSAVEPNIRKNLPALPSCSMPKHA